jgi:hypothetical protein
MNILRRRWQMDRRSFLRGAGTAIALPWLEAMGALSTSYSKAGELAPSERPTRAVFTQWGFGMNPLTSRPEGTGLGYALPVAAKPLEKFRSETTYFTGLESVDGGHSSDHSLLTGVNVRKGGKYGISCDQLIADSLDGKSRFPSLALSWCRATNFGGDGNGTLSWTKNRTPLMPENNPQALFDKLFRPESPAEIAAQRRRAADQRSILDAVREKARKLKERLGKADGDKLQEYLQSIRDIEEQLAVDARWQAHPKPKVKPVTFKIKGWEGWLRSMFDVLSLALQNDSTRVVTFLVRDTLNATSFPAHELGFPYGYHVISHNGFDPEKLALWTKADIMAMEDWAYFLDQLKDMREGTGTVLDHTMALWGTTSGGMAAHDKTDLRALLTGGTAVGVKHAGHIACANNVPLGNLMRTITEKMGVRIDDRFYGGCHSGTIKELS